jgi:hypothetical protein
MEYTTDKLPVEAICDRGYRGKAKIRECKISVPKPLQKNSTRQPKELEQCLKLEPILPYVILV